jgi:hypothetical protein
MRRSPSSELSGLLLGTASRNRSREAEYRNDDIADIVIRFVCTVIGLFIFMGIRFARDRPPSTDHDATKSARSANDNNNGTDRPRYR